jgi:hypothetical protein
VGTVTATHTTDALSGTLTIKGSDGSTSVINLATGNNGSSYDQATLLTAINNGGYGITATQAGTGLTFTSTDSTVTVTGANVTTTTGGDTAAFTASLGYYTVGVTDNAVNTVADTFTGQTAIAPAGFAGNTGGSGGVATMSYTDGAGEALNTTDLSNQTDAEKALNMLNVAISDVAAQDDQPGDEHAAGECGVRAERDSGHRLCLRNVEYVEVRNFEPDRHRRAGTGQQRAAGSDQAIAVITDLNKRRIAAPSRQPRDGRRQRTTFAAHFFAVDSGQ